MDSAAQPLVDIRQINHAAAQNLKASRWPRAFAQENAKQREKFRLIQEAAPVIASAAKQSYESRAAPGLLRRFAPRNDGFR